MNERFWIRKIQQKHDEKSADKLTRKYYKEIYIFVYKQTLDEQLALDLTQEIFIRMLRSIASYEEEKSAFRTWLYRIAANHCIDYLRSKQHQMKQVTVYTVDEEQAELEDSMLQLEYKEQYEAVNTSLQKQSGSIQQIVRYKIFAELTFIEIAKLLQMPESTVKTNYYKAIRILRKEMEAYYEDEV